MNNTLFVVDIDNTIADASRRLEAAGPEPEKGNKAAYIRWLEDVQNDYSLAADPQIRGMRDLIAGLTNSGDVIYLTSREEKYRKVTRAWIEMNEFPPAPLYMRQDGSWEDAHELKRVIIEDVLEDNQFLEHVVVLDDDPSGKLAEVCKESGWTFLKAGG